LRSPKYDWLLQWLYSATLVKQNVAKRKRREVQAVPAELQTRNALYVVDVGKSVTMAKTRAPNGRMQRLSDRLFDCHRSEIQQSEVKIKVNYGHSRGNENEHSCFSQQEMSSTHVRAQNVMRRPVNFLALPP